MVAAIQPATTPTSNNFMLLPCWPRVRAYVRAREGKGFARPTRGLPIPFGQGKRQGSGGQGVRTAVSLRYIRASPRYPDSRQPTAAERLCSATTRNPYPASAKIYRKKIKKRLTFHLSSIFLLFFNIYFCQWVKTLMSFIFICSSKFAFCWRVSERHR